MKRRILSFLALLAATLIALTSCASIGGGADNVSSDQQSQIAPQTTQSAPPIISDDAEIPALSGRYAVLSEIPGYSDSPFYAINGNVPSFSASQYTDRSYEYYSELDGLGRCGIAVACIGTDIMPTEDRGDIGSVKPSGWQSVKYDVVDGKYLYNRCHLIGFQLSGENANKQNLITGTRYMNVDGMLPFENMIADYVKETENHVLLRVTPIYDGDDLVASGVQMEAYSIEDNGDGICFNVFVYNVQPGVIIDYANGNSRLSGTPVTEAVSESVTTGQTETQTTYVLNTNTKKFHYPTCSSAAKISETNKSTFTGTRSQLISDGYSACGVCDP